MTLTKPLNVIIAGQAQALLTNAAADMLGSDPRVGRVDIITSRIDARAFRAAAPDLLLSAAHPFLIGPELLAIPRLGCVGLHPGRLPKYRGSYPLWWALRQGEVEAGLTLYVLDSGIDSGPVLDQRRVPIHPHDTFSTLYGRVVQEVAPLLDALLGRVAELGRLPGGQPQDEAMATVFRAPPRRDRARMKAFWAARRTLHLALRRFRRFPFR